MVLWEHHDLLYAIFTHYAAIAHEVGRIGPKEWIQLIDDFEPRLNTRIVFTIHRIYRVMNTIISPKDFIEHVVLKIHIRMKFSDYITKEFLLLC